MYKYKKEKKLRLPRSNNGTHRKQATLGCYQYQKDELFKRAASRNMSVSYYLNWLLWRDWINPNERKPKKADVK